MCTSLLNGIEKEYNGERTVYKMKKKILLLMRSVFSLLHIAIAKAFNITGFFSASIQDFSCSTKFAVGGGGKIRLMKKIHTKRNVIFEADGGTIDIGEGCFFNNGSMVVAKERVSIGKRCAFGPNTLIYDHDHNIYSEKDIHDSGFLTSPVVIGDNVWIGANSVILRGSVIGNGCVIGAGSVIKGIYPADTVVIQKRNEDIIAKNISEGRGVHNIDRN